MLGFANERKEENNFRLFDIKRKDERVIKQRQSTKSGQGGGGGEVDERKVRM